MINRTEEEIISNWNGNINKPLVSVCCITYNHETFISEALDSFLLQETDFPIEVIIRDDASVDKTADIIKEYVKKYPKIVKPIYETENGFQKGIKAFPETLKKASGTFIALCEGDDYWTDIKKLQIQVDQMNNVPNVDISFHFINELKDGKEGKILGKQANETKVFLTSELILGGGEFCPTASLMIRRECIVNLPLWFYNEAPVGDYFIQILASLKGGALYINRNMAIYRVSHASSWTSNVLKNLKNSTAHFYKMIHAMEMLDQYTNFKYKREISIVNSNFFYHIAKNLYKLGKADELIYVATQARQTTHYSDNKIKILFKLITFKPLQYLLKIKMMNRPYLFSMIYNKIFISIFFRIYFILMKDVISVGKNYNFTSRFKIQSDGSRFQLKIGENFSARRNLMFTFQNASNLIIGDNVFFNNNCSLNCLDSIEIGNDVLFGENIKIYDHNHRFKEKGKLIHEQGFTAKSVVIGSNVWIGSNVTILMGVKIGNNVVIGSNCLIYKSIPDNCVVKSDQQLLITDN
ncbi:MAG: glycosyltransferase [Sulfuricurvum sp.]|nr:glycosyltransferase [Sulfuricurvum sp.]